MPRGVYDRVKSKKGKWSKIAKANHSVRMKERWKAKRAQPGFEAGIDKVSIKERLIIIENQAKAILQQMGY